VCMYVCGRVCISYVYVYYKFSQESSLIFFEYKVTQEQT